MCGINVELRRFHKFKKKKKKKAMINRKYQRPKNRGLQNSKQKNKFTKKKIKNKNKAIKKYIKKI